MTNQKINVLIVDNSKEFHDFLKNGLSSYSNINIIGIAENGVEAIEMLKQKKPDVLLLDIVMPKMNGIKVLRQLNLLNYKKSAIIIMTALRSNLLEILAISLGANIFIRKPFDIRILVKNILLLSNKEDLSDQLTI